MSINYPSPDLLAPVHPLPTLGTIILDSDKRAPHLVTVTSDRPRVLSIHDDSTHIQRYSRHIGQNCHSL